MELGLSTSLLGLRALPDGLAVFGALGVPWVEIHGYMPEEFDFGDASLVDRTRRALERYHLRLWSCHSPSGREVDLASSDDDLRLRSRALLEAAMRASADLGARVFVCDAARPHTDDSPAQSDGRRRLYADSLRALLDVAAPLSLRLVIENQPRGGARFVSPDDFVRLETDYGLGGLGACWDTGHGWIAGQAPEVACCLGTRLATIHAHDNDGQGDRHWLPSRGGIAWAPFLTCLRRIGYAGPFMMELGPPDPPTPDAVQRLASDAVAIYRRLVEPGPG